jgi:hypothetical protein
MATKNTNISTLGIEILLSVSFRNSNSEGVEELIKRN